MREYRDYIPPEARSLDNRRWWQPIDCARDVYNYILDLCDGFQTNLPEPFFSLTQYCRLDTITVPNPYLYGADPPSSIKGGKWCRGIELECARDNGKPTSPYMAQATLHYYNGREGSILWGELAALITAMHNRAIQPDIDIQTSRSYMERGYVLKEELGNRLAFPQEKRFPVVMLSFMGPQHGRILYAFMDGEQLVLRQSRLFSFERKANAPFALFQRILLSHPIAER
ncbi:predicted protein [Aspergillus terreus NIH2624]|uniref:Uncharacterized protein n=1 Tax=Aspergillus terreus (strain NIH 2624 / FGSC A1156) TaxID=341663 RepID=Q0C9I5_ASPTN|nr:uncharacterized protein ATEG_09649 [Aspergillus terreus NIH2624]EAU29840.1 predicted protein [Aspergillus terreus NIH2624]